MLGLRKGTVQVVPHQATWHENFAHERRILQDAIGPYALDIQHVGSTAVEGLDAKPIIDIAVAVRSLAMIAPCTSPLIALGYLDRGDHGSDGGYLFVKECAPEVKTHHLHVVTIDDPQWRNYLCFRDLLAVDAALRAEYGALKRVLGERFGDDRQNYTRAKADFIRAVIDTACVTGPTSD